MNYLRQSTGVTVIVGPFLDKTDGLTPKTALADQSANGRLFKTGTGAAFTANSWAHDGIGYYGVGLTTTHTNTVGPLRLAFSDATTFVPLFEDWTVLAAVQYDALVANSDNFDVSVIQIDGQATTGNNATLNLKQLNIVNSAGTALVANSTGGNGNGIYALGNGTGSGLQSIGGTTGAGIDAAGANDTSAAGAGYGLRVSTNAATHGALVIGGSGGSAAGMRIETQGSGNGLYILGGVSGGSALKAETQGGSGTAAIRAVSVNGPGMSTEGGVNGSGFSAAGAGTGHGMLATSGTGATGDGMKVIAASTNGNGLEAIGTGTGRGIAETPAGDISDEYVQ